jgi:GDP-D-mannose dehydratase
VPRLETLPDMARSASVARVAAVAGQRLDPELYVKSDPEFLRPAEVDHLVGDATKAREQAGSRGSRSRSSSS